MTAPSSYSAKTARSGDNNLDELLKRLDIRDDELDAVVVGKEEVKKFEADACWLAIGKLNTDRPFSSDVMFETLKFAWGQAQTQKYREAGENLFIFQMFRLGDWKKVVHGIPWNFRGFGLIVEECDGHTDPASVTLDGFYVWARIHKVSDIYLHEPIVDQLARRIGKVKEVHLSPGLLLEGDYDRVRAWVLVSKPLTCFTPLTVEGKGTKILMVKYKKNTFFCAVCGLMGH